MTTDSSNTNKIPFMTLTGNYLHYAVEAKSVDGRYVLCLTQSLTAALAVLRTRLYEVEEELDGEPNVYETIEGKIIPFQAGQEVWLGFPFRHRGAKEAVANLGMHAEETQEAVLTEEGYQAIHEEIEAETKTWFSDYVPPQAPPPANRPFAEALKGVRK